MENKCPFCNKEEIKKRIIKTSRYFFAIQPRTPLRKGHTLVISKIHRSDFLDLKIDESKALVHFVQKIIKNIPANGYNVFTNIGESAGQSVKHFHLHILPRSNKEKTSPFEKINKKTKA